MRDISLLKQNILQYLDFKGVSKYEFYQKTGVSNGILSQKNGLSEDNIMRFLSYYKDINPEWLLTGQGSMLKSEGLEKRDEVSVIPIQYMRVPMIPIKAQAGFLTGYGDVEYMDGLPFEYWETDKEYKGNYLCFEVKGDSMDNGTVESILEGDKILCREIQKHHWKNKLHIHKWNFVIVHKEEGVIVKRITEHNTETGQLKLHSLNPFFDDYVINLKDVVALYNVVDLKRRMKI